MKKVLWINLILLIFFIGCSSTKKFTIKYNQKSQKILTKKPIIVKSLNKNGNHAKSIFIDELKSNGYEVIQDIQITENLIKPFGADQVVPTADFTEILVSMELDEYTENSNLQSANVKLSDCNYLLEKDQCTYRSGTKRQYNTIVKRNGKIHFTIKNAAEDSIIIIINVTSQASGIIPRYTNVSLSKSIRSAIKKKFSPYFIRTENITPDYEIDKMTADFIENGIYETAAIRVKKHESGYTYYYTMGLIEETQKNYSGAKMYYSEGELNTDKNELFSNAIKRIDYFLIEK